MINSPTVYLSQVLVGDIQQRGCAPGKAGEGGGCRAPPPATASARAGESRGPPGARLGRQTRRLAGRLWVMGAGRAPLCAVAVRARPSLHVALSTRRQRDSGGTGRGTRAECSPGPAARPRKNNGGTVGGRPRACPSYSPRARASRPGTQPACPWMKGQTDALRQRPRGRWR